MLHIVISCTDTTEGEQVKRLLTPLLEEWQEQPLYREFVQDRNGFLKYVGNNPYLIMVVVQSGPEGFQTAKLARETNQNACLVWLSEKKEQALESYGCHATHFALLPVTTESLRCALESCRLARERTLRIRPPAMSV